jgi:hypothetical protein
VVAERCARHVATQCNVFNDARAARHALQSAGHFKEMVSMLDLINARKRDDGLTAETAVAGSHTVARAGVTQLLRRFCNNRTHTRMRARAQHSHTHTHTHTHTHAHLRR